jgi:hypothetical protein
MVLVKSIDELLFELVRIVGVQDLLLGEVNT